MKQKWDLLKILTHCHHSIRFINQQRFTSLILISQISFSSSHDHQTSHLSTGFILDPRGQLKSLANSLLLENGPCTLNIPGEWTPVLILFSSALSLYFEHQVLAALIQNIWNDYNYQLIQNNCHNPFQPEHLSFSSHYHQYWIIQFWFHTIMNSV